MWLLALDTVSGRPRAPTMVTAVAATLLLELIERDVVILDHDTVTSTEQATQELTTILEFGRVRLLQAARSGTLRPSDAIDALYADVWTTVGQDLAYDGITQPRHQRLPRRTPRWDLPQPQARTDVVRALLRALHSPDTLDPGSHRLAAVLWATDTAEHGLSEDSLLNDNADSLLAPIMNGDPLAADLTRAVAHLISPSAFIGGSSTLS